MEKYTRLIGVLNRSFRSSETMCEIFLAHVDDIVARGTTELVPLVCETGVEMVLISPVSRVVVTPLDAAPVTDIATTNLAAITHAA